ncbi:MAG TPA: YraN family protein [Opitutaceae bacterium]|jgi:putative endonuclease|nr:YraN family protein [Opitutaceae bacterium]
MDDHTPPAQDACLPPVASRGPYGEQLAADYLIRRRGYRIIARNWRNPDDEREEIDLVALDGDIVVFVEVKTRSAQPLVPGFYRVGPAKKKVLRRAAKAYLRRCAPKPRTFRLDVVEVELGAGDPVVLHFIRIPLFTRYDRA